VVFVHAKDLEQQAVKDGYFVNRRDVMYNDFIIIGPPEDPAGIMDTRTASVAFSAIASKGHTFVSRGDNSGTNRKELAIWKESGYEPKDKKWYLEVGQGMAKTQRIASEKRAYTLTDRGTWLATKDRGLLDMTVVLEGDPILLNQYGVMAVNPARHSQSKYKEAMQFINWLVSDDGQKAIALYRDNMGNKLFIPNAG
jgi:tungstate transport system substrate-binding protein